MNNENGTKQSLYATAVRELYFFLRGNNDNFHSLLYRLIEKADHANRTRLRVGFPYEVRAWEMWQDSDDEAKFFDAWLKKENDDGKAMDTCSET